jgi:hypothetical protein
VRILPRFILVLFTLSVIPLDRGYGHAASHRSSADSFGALSVQDRRAASQGTRLAAHNRTGAITWLRKQRLVAGVVVGSADQAIEIDFRDRARFLIFPPIAGLNREPHTSPRAISFQQAGPPGPATKRAAVLEPFGTALGLGGNSGQVEADALTKAGFQVDVFRDSAVTVPVIESLSSYSVVYMESHSNYDPGIQDGFVLDGERYNNQFDQEPYKSLEKDGSIYYGSPQNDPGHFYIAFTSKIFSLHMSGFPYSSILFMNGCSLLKGSPRFEQAVLGGGVSAFISWTDDTNNRDAEQAADFMFPRLATGETLSAAFAEVQAALLDTSFTPTGVARLTIVGDLNDSFPNALEGATPTPTPTPVQTLPPPTSTPTETPTETATPLPPPVLSISITGGVKVDRDSTVRVTVTDEGSSRPVTGAQVTLDGRKVGLPAVMRKKTGVKGQVVFKHLQVHRKGTITLQISKSGFEAVKKSLKAKG